MQERLVVWERSLKKASKMLETTKRRNALLKESADKEKEFRQIEKSYKKIMQELEEFDEKFSNELIHSAVTITNFTINNQFEKITKDYDSDIKKYKKAAKFTCKIEKYKNYFLRFQDVYQNLKLDVDEYSKKNIYEILIILLSVNYNNEAISEDVFFESKEAFYEILRKSDDQIFNGLLENGKDITQNTTIDDFLELF